MIDGQIREEILARLRGVESAEGVRVLYAVESGSRAWGFPSRDSDYDVRFIYIHTRDWYLSVNTDSRRDVIERPITDEIDMGGWDIRKAFRLLAKGNPPLGEWLASPILYTEFPGFADRMRALRTLYHNPAAAVHHYFNMARNNDREYMHRAEVRLKKYFYILRPLLAIRWLLGGRGPVPMAFSEMFVTIAEQPALVAEIQALVARKMEGDELGAGPAIPVISEFIERELESLRASPIPEAPRHMDMEPLNELFRETLVRAWE